MAARRQYPLRLSERERAMLDDLTEWDGCKDWADWLRAVIREHHREGRRIRAMGAPKPGWRRTRKAGAAANSPATDTANGGPHHEQE